LVEIPHNIVDCLANFFSREVRWLCLGCEDLHAITGAANNPVGTRLGAHPVGTWLDAQPGSYPAVTLLGPGITLFGHADDLGLLGRKSK
jgi:hypothetical protein